MNLKIKKQTVTLSLFILLSSFVCASISVGTYYIDNQYETLEDIKGWINISFTNEEQNSMFSDSFGNSISLINLLKNQTYDYTCVPSDCSSNYSATNSQISKTFNLGVKDSKIIGIKIDEEITGINSVNFTVESSAGQSCYNQIKVDFLGDGTEEFGNSKSASGICSFTKTYGCFDSEQTTNQYAIGKFPIKHCQKIKLPEAAGFKIGAWIKSEGDARDITVALYDLNGNAISGKSCSLPLIVEGETYCEIDYLITKPGEYYVCIYSDEEGTSKVKGYSSSNGCGFYAVNFPTGNAAFQIFAEGKMFDSVGKMDITNVYSGSDTLSGDIENYIQKKYGGFDCSSGCVIPIVFNSEASQDITTSSLQLEYETILGPTTGNNFYDLTGTPAKISSSKQKLYLDKGGFTVPSGYGNETFTLSFKGNGLFSKNITIEKLPIIEYVTPTSTASAYPTKFRVKIDSSTNTTKYDWNFGDGKNQTTTMDHVTHTYNSTGTYDMKITVTDNLQRSSYKTFEITVESPEKIINQTLKTLQETLEEINLQLNIYPEFDRKSINNALSLETMKEKLTQSKKDYKDAITEEDYKEVLTDVLEIKIPSSILISKVAKDFSFYPEESVINPEILSEIGGGEYDSSEEENYIDGVLAWYHDSIDSKVTFKEYSGAYTDYEEPIVRTFELNIKKKTSGIENAYIIFEGIDGLNFKENYLEKDLSGYVYIEFDSEEETIVLSTTEDIDFATLPLFISPEIDRLPLIELPEAEEEPTRWWLFIAIIILIFFIGFITYIILQEWYRRKYENYLFKNRNDLYNLVTYIQASRDKGISDKTINSKLRKAGWSSEQMRYAMRKYAGKRTGMLEIPIRKIMELFGRSDSKQSEK